MKLLIISGFHFDYCWSVAQAFKRLGHEVALCEYSLRNKGIKGFIRYSILGRLGYDGSIADCNNFVKETKEVISAFQPEGILVLRGTKKDFYSEIINHYIEISKNRPKTAIWLLDEIKNIHGGITSVGLFDSWFSIEPNDIDLLQNDFQIKAHFLPPGYDSSFYRALDKSEKSLNPQDLCFVGSFAQPMRLKYLEHISQKAWKENLKLTIISDSYRFPSIKLKNYPHLLKFLKNEGCGHARNNLLYNNCKVNLNIHADFSGKTEYVNSRFFEIMGSGGLQLVEPKRAQILSGFEPEKDFLTYSGFEELDEKIDYVLQNPKEAEAIASAGHEKAKNHDYLARAKFIMEQAFSI